MMADARKTQIMCHITPINASIVPIATACGSPPEQYAWPPMQYTVSTARAACGNLQGEEPMTTGSAQVNMSSATCSNGTSVTLATMSMATAFVAGTSASRRSGTTPWCQHAVIFRNGNLVGQKVGSGLSMAGLSGVQLCMTASVPTSERCSSWTRRDAATLNPTNSQYSEPLRKTVTVNAQGLWCIDGAEAGTTYVPILTGTGSCQCSSTLVIGGGPAPPPVVKTITQTITITSVSLAQYTGDVKLVYETAYAIGLNLWNTASSAMKAGCAVTSTATAARRAGVSIQFRATITNNPTLATSAESAATALASNASALVAHVNTAKTQLNKPNVPTPQASDLTIAQPAVVNTGGPSPPAHVCPSGCTHVASKCRDGNNNGCCASSVSGGSAASCAQSGGWYEYRPTASTNAADNRCVGAGGVQHEKYCCCDRTDDVNAFILIVAVVAGVIGFICILCCIALCCWCSQGSPQSKSQQVAPQPQAATVVVAQADGAGTTVVQVPA